MIKEVPKMKLYRYQPINKLTLTNLSKKKNWVADPLLFNDPFEFRIRDIYDINSVGNIVYLSEDEVKVRRALLKELESYGVVCYSKNEVNQLLWSHYADNHRGMCLVFEVEKKNESYLKQVKYAKTLPKIKFSKDEVEIEQNLIMLTTTKSEDWKYEDEYREIYFNKNIHEDYPGELVQIIFGCRCSIDDIQLVFDIIRPDLNKVIFSKTFIQKNTFLMGISSIPHVEGRKYEIPEYWNKTMEK